MRNFFRELDSNLSSALSPVVKWIIYICVGIYLVLLLLAPFFSAGPGLMVQWLGASVTDSILKGRIWQLITYAFMHGGFGHLFFNLLALYFFGQRLEYRWGSGPFARFCIIVGAGAVLTHLAVVGLRYAVVGSPMNDIIIGLSGVIYGIMIACAMYYPDDIVYFQFFIPIKLKYLVLIMGILTLLSAGGGLNGAGTGVAHLTHLGGLLFGFLYVKFPAGFEWLPVPRNPFRKKPKFIDPRERWRNFR